MPLLIALILLTLYLAVSIYLFTQWKRTDAFLTRVENLMTGKPVKLPKKYRPLPTRKQFKTLAWIIGLFLGIIALLTGIFFLNVYKPEWFPGDGYIYFAIPIVLAVDAIGLWGILADIAMLIYLNRSLKKAERYRAEYDPELIARAERPAEQF